LGSHLRGRKFLYLRRDTRRRGGGKLLHVSLLRGLELHLADEATCGGQHASQPSLQATLAPAYALATAKTTHKGCKMW